MKQNETKFNNDYNSKFYSFSFHYCYIKVTQKVSHGRESCYNDTQELFLLILTGEYGIPSAKFGKNASKAPPINGHVIIHPKNDLR